ncbi:hypothetical protein EPI10_031520 [Gossypium australe]|uniref:Uncharacterized protein n=1 Tax=Gossypium australe TaxID=47621 RepID=A0A5B6X489_9ROSI|nr:hypothetical protein EPI10_031520 [Gossypium australe]
MLRVRKNIWHLLSLHIIIAFSRTFKWLPMKFFMVANVEHLYKVLGPDLVQETKSTAKMVQDWLRAASDR